MKTYKVTIEESVTKWYDFESGKLHREDGPAVEWTSGTKCWYRDGKCHREDGPAVEYAAGAKYWYRDRKLHREDGPACEYDDGSKRWFLNGVQLTEDQCKSKMASRTPSCDGKTVTIDGVVYTLTKV